MSYIFEKENLTFKTSKYPANELLKLVHFEEKALFGKGLPTYICPSAVISVGFEVCERAEKAVDPESSTAQFVDEMRVILSELEKKVAEDEEIKEVVSFSFEEKGVTVHTGKKQLFISY